MSKTIENKRETVEVQVETKVSLMTKSSILLLDEDFAVISERIANKIEKRTEITVKTIFAWSAKKW